ncbi:RNA helicase required for poly(A+) mRNA export [Allomyces javanicus]|nr:RNA helicase required for poly(A+) mRNA export [Allomyces javanicus]
MSRPSSPKKSPISTKATLPEPAPAPAPATSNADDDAALEADLNDLTLEQPKATGLYEEFESHEIEVTLANDSHAATAATTFEALGLAPELLKGLYAMNFTKPSKVQERALPLLLRDPPTNLIAQSQSGTGKTAAFALTMLSRIDYTATNAPPQAVCMTNTRELALQIVKVVREMGQFTPVKVCMAVKDEVPRGAKVTDHIVIGTPGTILDLNRKRQLDFKNVKVLVLDEADAMLDAQNLGEQSRRVRQVMPKTAQVLLFSATFPDHVKSFATAFAPSANMIVLKREEVKVEAIKQFYLRVKGDKVAKFEKLSDLYGLLTVGQSIIFTQTKATAMDVAKRMQAEGHQVSMITGDLLPADRDQVMADFRSGKSKVLIATNVLARGIDVPQINLVVNYDLPVDEAGRPDLEVYVHRIGRTGRFGRSGVSINFIDGERAMSIQNKIVAHYAMQVTEMPDDFEAMEKMLRDFKFN